MHFKTIVLRLLKLQGVPSLFYIDCIARLYKIRLHLRKFSEQQEVGHLTFPNRIFSVEVKSGACYIMGQWDRVENKTR